MVSLPLYEQGEGHNFGFKTNKRYNFSMFLTFSRFEMRYFEINFFKIIIILVFKDGLVFDFLKWVQMNFFDVVVFAGHAILHWIQDTRAV